MKKSLMDCCQTREERAEGENFSMEKPFAPAFLLRTLFHSLHRKASS